MEDKEKETTIELAAIINKTTINFLVEFLKDNTDIDNDINTHKVINIVFSSHISSLYNSLSTIVKDHPIYEKSVKKYLDRIIEFISVQHIIEIMESK